MVVCGALRGGGSSRCMLLTHLIFRLDSCTYLTVSTDVPMGNGDSIFYDATNIMALSESNSVSLWR